MKIWERKKIQRYASSYTSFVFVRDPFSRLFSGYLDKIFIQNVYTEVNSKVLGKCALKVSFPDFAEYVANGILNNSIRDGHFYPMWVHCNPCEMNITYIGKMETFMEDTKYILSSAGIDINKVTGSQNDTNVDIQNDRSLMIDLAHRTFNRIQPKDCISKYDTLQRLWTIYKIRGYLSKHQEMPLTSSEADMVTPEQFIDMVLRKYEEAGTKSERTLQREEAMLEGYSLVPTQTLLKLAVAYDTDCRVFDYDCDVRRRFLDLPKVKEKFYFRQP